MNDNATTSSESPEGTGAAAPAEATRTEGNAPARRRRGGRGGRRGQGGESGSGSAAAATTTEQGASRPRRPDHPVLEWLASQHPVLFGEKPQPLKRGIFQDLMALHGEALDKDGLKLALSLHTRSTRYLVAMASGQPRRNLQGEVVEPVAPEHHFHALSEVFRRRQQRSAEDLTPQWLRRLVIAIEVSGLSREAYAECVQVRDAKATEVLQAALSEVATRDARAEAMLRAFESSGVEVSAFADMYGLPNQQAEQLLARGRQLRAAAQAAQPAPQA